MNEQLLEAGDVIRYEGIHRRRHPILPARPESYVEKLASDMVDELENRGFEAEVLGTNAVRVAGDAESYRLTFAVRVNKQGPEPVATAGVGIVIVAVVISATIAYVVFNLTDPESPLVEVTKGATTAVTSVAISAAFIAAAVLVWRVTS